MFPFKVGRRRDCFDRRVGHYREVLASIETKINVDFSSFLVESDIAAAIAVFFGFNRESVVSTKPSELKKFHRDIANIEFCLRSLSFLFNVGVYEGEEGDSLHNVSSEWFIARREFRYASSGADCKLVSWPIGAIQLKEVLSNECGRERYNGGALVRVDWVSRLVQLYVEVYRFIRKTNE